jgi:hypothetical protein
MRYQATLHDFDNSRTKVAAEMTLMHIKIKSKTESN